VRRQAVASLRAIYFIVQFQALFRGNRVRSTNNGLGMHTKLWVSKLICFSMVYRTIQN
jgi:hypothetical protein